MSAGSSHVILIGAGKMGGGMLRGWLKRPGFPIDKIWMIEPQAFELAQSLSGGNYDHAEHCISPNLESVRGDIETLPRGTIAAIIIAIKPQVFAQILPLYREIIAKHHPVVISIAAGQSLARISDYFPNQAIIRTMPNLPASIGRGVSVAVANEHVTAAQKKLATGLLAACGSVHWIDDETKMDAVTAVSGSGPAYLFYLCEILADAARDNGIESDMADQLARQTIIGAAGLLENSPESAAQLRQNVTSPGGTTEAALKILMANQAVAHAGNNQAGNNQAGNNHAGTSYSAQFKAAIAAAAARSRELAAK